jgi:tetratricopeptide (TPR) repeat protein/SAM-dependent methyltransferase
MPLSANLKQLFDAALALHRAGELESAGRAYQEILDAHPEQPDALNLLAMIAMEDGRPAEAAELLGRAIAVSAEVPQFHCNLGNALLGAGDLPAAVEAYRRAIALRADYTEALSSLGFALAQTGQASQAVEYFDQALAIIPDYFFALNNLGDVLSEQGELGGAADAYVRAIAVEPNIAELHTKLGAVLREQGRLPEAVEQLWAAIDLGDDDLRAHRLLGSLLRLATPSAYDRDLEQRLVAYLGTEGVDHGDVTEFATALVKLKYADEERFGERSSDAFVVDTLLSDALVRAVLTRSVNGDEDMERLLTGARRHLLLGGAHATDAVMSAMSVLAQQCFNNEYVFSIAEDEAARLGAVRADLESRGDWISAPGVDVQCTLLLLGMYEPLGRLPMAARLAEIPVAAWHESLRPMVQRSLLDRLEEAALEAAIPVVGAVENPVSRAVREQYEENPYPRWLTPAYRTPGNVHGILRGMFPDFEPPEVLKGPIRVLVVGCGTGRHAISIALRYDNAEVLATDISRRSLAFGARMAGRLGVDNVRFVENDLLNLSELDGEFHIIECVGVLHHMQSIADGVGVLVEKLHAGGLLKLGLYSETAREPVARAREKIAELGLTAAADDIRRFRDTVFSAPPDDPLRRILGFGDFYTLSNCRDLLFHVHEQNVTLAGVRGLLRDTGLRFIGFETVDTALTDGYRRRYPEDTSMDDLSRWEAVEEELPGAFSTLYQCWCTRAA